MFTRLTSYFLGGTASEGAEEGETSQQPRQEDGATQQQQQQPQAAEEHQQAGAGNVTAIPVEARLRQVEVEGDDWILIDRNVEGAQGMDESWYVTPPACFTQPGPVHVETSPLEDLLIEHPSMSVYRAAGSKSHHHHNHKKSNAKRRPLAPKLPTTTAPVAATPATGAVAATSTGAVPRTASVTGDSRLPLAPRNANLPTCKEVKMVKVISRKPNRSNSDNSGSNSNRPSHHPHNNHHSHHHHNQHNGNNAGGAVVEQAPRRTSMRELRNARGDENLAIVQTHYAQKMMEKRSSQSAKRNRLERGNKVREVASGCRRPSKRQDRIRSNNSGANNNRRRY